MPQRGQHRAYMFGRRVRPLAFWTGYVTVVLLAGIALGMIVGTTLDDGIGRILAVPGAAVVVLLLAGFWANRPRLMSWGLLIATGVWSTVAAVALSETWSTSISGWLAVGWAGVNAWAWWIEAGDAQDGA